ncbi:unnamed protein product [Commensalibacter papalotli (ex Botero et al. 2024)]|uniref:Uncharacterized protein n=1 Tax=Commensalibacter papalotli (ex Botero et al. 2024) TaxID=2972766 RepID=A0ABN8WDK4_9PROT|nr:unnamed protein product [Commensalibacter papalotli (ex Botero et al. 2024)]
MKAIPRPFNPTTTDSAFNAQAIPIICPPTVLPKTLYTIPINIMDKTIPYSKRGKDGGKIETVNDTIKMTKNKPENSSLNERENDCFLNKILKIIPDKNDKTIQLNAIIGSRALACPASKQKTVSKA